MPDRIRHLALALIMNSAALLAMTCPAMAQEADGAGSSFRLGLGIGASTSEYRGTDAKARPVPIVLYEGERLFWRGLTAGAHLYNDYRNQLSLFLSYMPHNFDASDSDDPAIRLLNDRDSTLMAGAGYRLMTDWGVARLGASFDTLGNNKGMLFDASYAYPFRFGSFTLTPRGGAIWASENFNDYYYGISRIESARSGLAEYHAGAGVSPYARLNLHMDVSESWRVFLDGGATFLSDEITDSPMVGKSVTFGGGAGVAYAF